MKQAVIDIGSNSMRLSVYETTPAGGFSILFKDKFMAGLAGYVEEGALSQEGIDRAILGLRGFRSTLEALGIHNVAVFATASLRNIRNTRPAVEAIQRATGFPIEVISGQEEARFGYLGAMEELALPDGLFVDIGGASTEVVRFTRGQIVSADSCPVGSLKLYRDWVKKILPNHEAVLHMQAAIRQATLRVVRQPIRQSLPLVCVGGTARAALKLTRRICRLPESVNWISAQQLEEVVAALSVSQKTAADLILKTEPERIHTLIPGMLILRHMVEGFGASQLIVSKYGVREGYLCQKIRRAAS
ncbi:MAG: hypothetical protein MR910_08470 [Clostridiales bacterium]|nr:hypothetical protein [Clostridiales bacterium]